MNAPTMGAESTFRPNSAGPLAKSLALHLGLVLCAVGIGAQRASEAPLGNYRKGDPTIVEISLRMGAPARVEDQTSSIAAAPEIKDAMELAKKKPKKKASPANAQAPSAAPANASAPAGSEGKFGARDGITAEGPIGEPDGKVADALERYLYELRILLEGRKIYPLASRQLRETGRVIVRFEILKDGRIQGISLAEPTGFARLNQAATQLIADLGKFKPLPALAAQDLLEVKLPIRYALD